MTPVSRVILPSIILISLQLSDMALALGFPNFSWDWGGPSENYTKIVTSPEVIQRFSLDYPFTQCSHGMEGVMTRLHVSPCIRINGRCRLKRGENVTLDLEFISNIPAGSLNGSLSAIFTRWFSPLTLGDPENLCNSDLIVCPVQPFVPYRYRISIPIRSSIPMLSPDIKLLIKGDENREIACAIVPITISEFHRDGTTVVDQPTE